MSEEPWPVGVIDVLVFQQLSSDEFPVDSALGLIP
jgi:hypothetical protein